MAYPCGHERHGLLKLECGHTLRWPEEGPEPPYNGDPPAVGWSVFCWPRCRDFRRIVGVVVPPSLATRTVTEAERYLSAVESRVRQTRWFVEEERR